jgi:hypothetical protein
MTKELDIKKFSRLCNRVEKLNEIRDSELTRPNSKQCTQMCINRCMDEVLYELEESGTTNVKHS